MRTIRTGSRSHLAAARLRGLFLLGLALLAAGCEAPLNLEQVQAEKARELRRYDMFQAAAHSGEKVVVVSSIGAAIVSLDNGISWRRFELDGRPSLISVTACPDGQFYALDAEHRVWQFTGDEWQSSLIDTPENTLSIHCAPNGRLWVAASFSTLYWSEGDLQQWNEFSMYEDLQFTEVRFVDDQNGFALGEFGTVVATEDGGDTWEPVNFIPNEFYPMAVDFLDANNGWVGGLDGVIWQTTDGGQSWERQQSVTSAPIYNIHASEKGVFAVGGSGKLVTLQQGNWRNFEGAPEVLAFMRGVDLLSNGSLLVAGDSGTLAIIEIKARNDVAQR